MPFFNYETGVASRVCTRCRPRVGGWLVAKLALLAEQTAYERYALSSAIPLIKIMSGSIDLRRDPRGDIHAILGGIDSGAEILERYKLKFVPLIFGAAWKILDLVVEDSLGPLPPSRRGRPQQWRIVDKAAAVLAQNGAIKARKPFTRRNPEWMAAMRMYANTLELRHAITHRDAGREANGNLDISVTDVQGVRRRYTLSLDEQLAFCRATRRLIRAILAKRIDQRDRDDLAYHLAQVRQHSQLQVAGRDLSRVREVIVNLEQTSPGVVRLDVPALQATMRYQPGPWVFDLVAYLPGNLTPLVGPLETAPAREYEFAVASPPRWLSYNGRMRTTQE
jgi:hypothetical protein